MSKLRCKNLPAAYCDATDAPSESARCPLLMRETRRMQRRKCCISTQSYLYRKNNLGTLSFAWRCCLARIHRCREMWLVAHAVFSFTTGTVIVRPLKLPKRRLGEMLLSERYLRVTLNVSYRVLPDIRPEIMSQRQREVSFCFNFSWCDRPLMFIPVERHMTVSSASCKKWSEWRMYLWLFVAIGTAS